MLTETLLGGPAPLLLICEHASAVIPTDLNNLGLNPADRHRHIAVDIGAAAVTRGLSTRLQAPAVLAGVSRLVIDCNRPPDDPSALPETSDGTPIPGNIALTAEAKAERVKRYHQPFHAAVADTLTQLRRYHPDPVIVSVHSFTPALRDQPPRPWHGGVLWGEDGRVAVPLMMALRAEAGLLIGDNQPYSGRSLFYSLTEHAVRAGLRHVALEIRQDLIADDTGVAAWVARLSPVLRDVLSL